jgi:hypothetical protein
MFQLFAVRSVKMTTQLELLQPALFHGVCVEVDFRAFDQLGRLF